jgi:hypothetical protein
MKLDYLGAATTLMTNKTFCGLPLRLGFAAGNNVPQNVDAHLSRWILQQ